MWLVKQGENRHTKSHIAVNQRRPIQHKINARKRLQQEINRLNISNKMLFMY
jgi:hypothetical protein